MKPTVGLINVLLIAQNAQDFKSHCVCQPVHSAAVFWPQQICKR